MDNLTRPALARLTGLLYLLVVPFGVFAILYVPSVIYVAGDPAATAANIQAHETLYRLGIVSDLAASFLMVTVVLGLYRLLAPVQRDAARLMVLLVIVGVAIAVLSQAIRIMPLLLLSGAEYLDPFKPQQLHVLSFLSMRTYAHASGLAFIYWGLWLLPLGYLVWKSGFLPKFLAVLLIIAGFGYIIDSFGALLGYRVGIGAITGIGEIAFILWLLIMGAKINVKTL